MARGKHKIPFWQGWAVAFPAALERSCIVAVKSILALPQLGRALALRGDTDTICHRVPLLPRLHSSPTNVTSSRTPRPITSRAPIKNDEHARRTREGKPGGVDGSTADKQPTSHGRQMSLRRMGLQAAQGAKRTCAHATPHQCTHARRRARSSGREEGTRAMKKNQCTQRRTRHRDSTHATTRKPMTTDATTTTLARGRFFADPDAS